MIFGFVHALNVLNLIFERLHHNIPKVLPLQLFGSMLVPCYVEVQVQLFEVWDQNQKTPPLF